MITHPVRAKLGIALALLVIALCLFGDLAAVRRDLVLGPISAKLLVTLRDPGTQWMVFVCAGIYFLGFAVFRKRNASLGGGYWSLGLLGAAALAYVLSYSEAVKSTQALTLIGGAAVGQGAAVWEGRRKNQACKSRGGATILALIILLALAAVWQGETGHLVQYRGQGRWCGPWDNPNTFGILMAVGVVLAVGRLVQSRVNAECGVRNAELPNAQGSTQSAECGGKHPAPNIQHPTSTRGLWARRVLLLAAAGVMGVGLVKSYSRGAWVGTAVGLLWLGINHEIHQRHENPLLGRARLVSCRSCVSWATLLVVSLCVVGFWSFGHTELAVARRAYSVANANDFSWRNRMAAWEGGLQMMAEKPWFGFGWNEPERIYSAFYCPAKVDEGMAFQLNDYFMLGATLGLPALLCFAVYILLALSGRQKTGLPAPPTLDFRLWTLDSAAVCRAGAAVLLVGFWFDGGLFELATAATFWVLLELGRAGDHEMHETHENE